jgi:dihydroorotase
MKSVLIKNARLIDPSEKMDETGSLLIKEGRIAWVGKAGQKPPDNNAQTVEAGEWVLAPGFIDLHCHLREPGLEEKETVASGAMAAARGGFTTICCMPNTQPAIDNGAVVNYVRKKAADCAVKVLPIGCITRGRKGESLAEMGEMAEAGVVGFSDDGNSVMNSRLLKQAMEYSRGFGLPVMEHCEDRALAEGGQINEGIVATRLGLAGIPAAAEESVVARDLALAALTGARLHICHISTSGAVEMVRQAKAKALAVTAEVTPHHLTLNEELLMSYDTNAKVNPPLRSSDEIKALLRGLRDGTIDAIATDHAPHTHIEKSVEFDSAPFGISGLETALGSLMSLVHAGELALPLLISKLSCEPAAIVGLAAPSLKSGSPADLVLFDPQKEWTVDPTRFASKGQNTPLAGRKLKGKVMMTYCQGNLVYKDMGDE